MTSFLYRCPKTGQTVQGWSADDGAGNGAGTTVYESVRCLACSAIHLINRSTGKVAGRDDEGP
jgi:hypothetical protein